MLIETDSSERKIGNGRNAFFVIFTIHLFSEELVQKS